MDEKNNSAEPIPAESPELTVITGGGEGRPRRGRRPVKPLAKPVYRTVGEGDLKIPTINGDAPVVPPTAAPSIDIPKPPASVARSKSPKKSVLAVLACIVLAFLLYQARFAIVKTISPKLYLSLASGRTVTGFRKELRALQKNNPVINQYSNINSKPSLHEMTFASSVMGFGTIDMGLEIQNDNQKKQMRAGATVPVVGDVAFYLSDKTGIVTIMGENYAFNPQAAGREITAFLDNNGILYDPEAIPSDLNLSYSALEKLWKSKQVSKISPEYQMLSDRYQKELNDLLADGQYKNESKEAVDLGSKSVKAGVVSITLKEDTVVDWLSDLADMVEEDEQLQALLGVFDRYAYDDLCSGIRSASLYYTGDLVLTVQTVQDRIIVVRANYKDENRQSYTIEAGTIGERYRLDSVYATVKGMGNSVGIKISGNHIGKGEFSSKISIRNQNTSTMQVKWDPEKTKNNLTVSVMNMAGFRATAAAVGDKVVVTPGNTEANGFSVFSGADMFSYTAQPLKENIVWPKGTEKLEDLQIASLLGFVPYY